MIAHPSGRLTLVVFLVLGTVSAAAAQEDAGSSWAAAAGGALGLYSGALLGAAGSMIPCTQTAFGVKCVRVAAAAGGVIGLIGGLYLGDGDEDGVVSSYKGAAYGALAGGVVGFTLKEIVPHYGWPDVATGAAIGAGIGASAKGSAIGLAAGAAIGVVLWRAVPAIEFSDAVGIGLLGVAVGGLSSWIVRAVNAQDGANPAEGLELSFNIEL